MFFSLSVLCFDDVFIWATVGVGRGRLTCVDMFIIYRSVLFLLWLLNVRTSWIHRPPAFRHHFCHFPLVVCLTHVRLCLENGFIWENKTRALLGQLFYLDNNVT